MLCKLVKVSHFNDLTLNNEKSEMSVALEMTCICDEGKQKDRLHMRSGRGITVAQLSEFDDSLMNFIYIVLPNFKPILYSKSREEITISKFSVASDSEPASF